TKSNLITRDLDLLTRIARHNTLVVHVTVTTTDAALARKLEPRAPRPDLRFAAVRKLRESGITAGVLCSPLLPGINDAEDSLRRVASQAASARASFLAAHALFLKSCSRPTWLGFVREHFPHLVGEYDQRYLKADFADGPYRRRMGDLLQRICRQYGLAPRSTDALITRDVGAAERKLPERAAAASNHLGQQHLFA
ncbi:MAG: radical SAM protein, partial [Rhodospirillales bacterium]|nr:radical SAM protein [Acetobacter sp.]